MTKSLSIFGKTPEISIAELESLYGPDKITKIDETGALIDIDTSEINFARLGGTIKLAKVLTFIESTKWRDIEQYLVKTIPEHLKYLPEGKLKLGLSVYDIDIELNEINRTGIKLKSISQKFGRSTRAIPNKEKYLNSAQVLRNKLTSDLGWEFVIAKFGSRTVIALNAFEQNIDSYSKRDFDRPMRDAKVGMLPPKLAQSMINLAVGNIKSSAYSLQPRLQKNCSGLDAVQGRIEARSESYTEVRQTSTGDYDTVLRQEQNQVASSAREQDFAYRTILDPFCGTGVILQEAALMGYDVYGTDLEQRMIDYSKANLDWLGGNFSHPPYSYFLDQADATDYKWQHHFDSLASECYLGQPFSSVPDREKLNKVRENCELITKKFLKNLANHTKPGFRLCLAVPAWRVDNKFLHLKMLDNLSELGYNRVSFKHVSDNNLIYYREDQIVARELLVLKRI